MLEQHVDLTNIRDMIDGDKELEKSLLATFIEGADENIVALENNIKDGEDPVWKLNAHSLKGSARSCGANILGELSSKAQDSFTDSALVKTALLEQIKAEYAIVKEFLMNIINS